MSQDTHPVDLLYARAQRAESHLAAIRTAAVPVRNWLSEAESYSYSAATTLRNIATLLDLIEEKP